jgi:septum formation topological specificity factor MinE
MKNGAGKSKAFFAVTLAQDGSSLARVAAVQEMRSDHILEIFQKQTQENLQMITLGISNNEEKDNSVIFLKLLDR